MNHLDYYAGAQRPVETCVVGSGGFGRSFLAQGMRVPLMNARIAVDVDASIAAAGFAALGVVPSEVALCRTAGEAQQAWTAGKYIAAADLAVVVGLPIDVVVEATGNPEAGARHGRLAIEADHHLVLVSKEVDSVVGPYLAQLARARGKVVTPVDGDQPSLLIGLITWAQTLGFEIIAAGKSSEYDFVYDPATQTMHSDGKTIDVAGFDDFEAQRLRPGDQPDQQARLVAVDRRHDLAARARELREVRANDAIDFLGNQHQVMAGIDRQAGVARAGLGIAGGLDDDVDRQSDDDRELGGGDVLAGGPGQTRFLGGPAERDVGWRDAERGESGGGNRRLDIDGDPRVHQRNAHPLRQKTAAETAAADDAGLDRALRAGVIIQMVHGVSLLKTAGEGGATIACNPAREVTFYTTQRLAVNRLHAIMRFS